MKNLLLTSAIFLVGGAFVPVAHAQDQAAPVTAVQPEVGAGAADAPAPVPMTANETTVPPSTSPAIAAANGEVVAALPDPATAQIEQSPVEKEINDQLSFIKPTVNVDTMHSLFFSVWEHDLITDARKGLNTRMPGTDDGVAQESIREIALAGIVYHSAKEWTIWLNGMRVSPTAIPDQVMDLKVNKESIDIQWFDQTTNQIFPIRLRPHQRFNLDTRIFLPG